MAFDRNFYYRELGNIQDECKKCLSFHCVLTMADGSMVDGIVESVDADNVSVLVDEDVDEEELENIPVDEQQRQYYGKGRRPRRKYRRYRRRAFPLANLAKIALLPYIAPLPYPYYPYL